MIDESELNILEAGIVSGAFKTLEGYELELLSLARKGLEREKHNISDKDVMAELSRLRAALEEARKVLEFHKFSSNIVSAHLVCIGFDKCHDGCNCAYCAALDIFKSSTIEVARIDEILKGEHEQKEA